MEQKTPKFRLRLNLFDALVLIAALAAAAVMGWLALRPQETETPAARTVEYTVVFQRVPEGNGALVQPGDQITDTVRNYAMGTVTSVRTEPAVYQALNQEEGCYQDSVVAGYEDVYVTIESACTDRGDALILSSGYDDLRVGHTAYMRGPGYLGVGPIVEIVREAGA